MLKAQYFRRQILNRKQFDNKQRPFISVQTENNRNKIKNAFIYFKLIFRLTISSSHFQSKIDNEDSYEKDPKFKVGDCVRITKYKNIFAKGYA